MLRVRLSDADRARIVAEAETAYPLECCGLLIGRPAGEEVAVNRIAPSANRHATPERAFEIDPRLWLDVARPLEGTEEDIVGLYHSHPDHPARPSPRDLEAAWGDGMVWIIVSVRAGRVDDTGCFVFREAPARFEEAAW